MKAIEDKIAEDQGAAYRQHLEKILPHMKDAYRGNEDNPFRTHLGASVIGRECGREIWYGFHWATKPIFGGRILRLFNRGHLEEARFIAALLTIGCEVFQQDENGNQYRISGVGGHFGGSGDGVALNVPDVPEGHPALCEFKTHNDKSFSKLKKEGLRIAKFEHFVQMETYMRKMHISYGLYMAVNKNDDSIYAEIITIDTILADQFIDRAAQIIMMPGSPKRISNSPGWFACTWCDHKEVCHNGKAPEKNCRTCVFSKIVDDGNWYCTYGISDLKVLNKDEQYAGCENYAVNPDLM